jgi:hypothetical protein
MVAGASNIDIDDLGIDRLASKLPARIVAVIDADAESGAMSESGGASR